MGFHINPQRFRFYKAQNISEESEQSDIKFYLNAGTDTYKVAQIFQEKCEHSKINYYFKVVNPDRSEHNRPDKMCIYSTFEHAENFLEIIQEIKKENPAINFQTPPMLTGRIDEFIGIGMDHIDDKETGSYNQKISKLCADAAINVFKGMSSDKIPDLITRHPEMLYKLRDEIKKCAKEHGIDEEKICVRPEVRQKTEMQGKQMPNKEENSTVTTQNQSHKDSRDIKQETQEQEVKYFVLKFVESYRHIETNSQYDKRLDREESDIEYVADYVNKYRADKIDGEYFLGIQPEVLDKYGNVDFSQNSIDRMFRMLNSANNLTIGNHRYLSDFCESPEIQSLLKQMQESPAVQNMISRAEIDKKMGNPGGRGSLRGETPAEGDVHLARKGFKSLKEKPEMSGRDDNYVFDTIIDSVHINYGYETEEELALAKVCCKQRGIKTQSGDLQGKYKLDIVNQTQNQDLIDPQKVKQDTIVAGINFSEINRYIREVKKQVLDVVKDGKNDRNK